MREETKGGTRDPRGHGQDIKASDTVKLDILLERGVVGFLDRSAELYTKDCLLAGI